MAVFLSFSYLLRSCQYLFRFINLPRAEYRLSWVKKLKKQFIKTCNNFETNSMRLYGQTSPIYAQNREVTIKLVFVEHLQIGISKFA